MKALIENKYIMIPLLLAFVLCAIGGDITAWVIKNTYLASWIESNKIENTYHGLDVSSLVICTVLAIAATISYVLQELLEGMVNLFEMLNDGKKTEDVDIGRSDIHTNKPDNPDVQHNSEINKEAEPGKDK
ncbi:hypothetical protein [Enterobacter hormaechei]|uniref:hypothetical protein n=1 Tax=Enterobacter hormaechei TaxID=158836 RepID=UPI0026EA0CA8|nr:hypothetical protein [Enterobacter hormaechei]